MQEMQNVQNESADNRKYVGTIRAVNRASEQENGKGSQPREPEKTASCRVSTIAEQ
jgi:hypothetical protein